MLSIAVDICKNVIDLVCKNREVGQESRIRISEVLNEISLVLDDTINKLLIDEYPHSNCAFLERLAKNLHFQLIDFVDPTTLDELHKILLESSNIEKEFAVRKEPETINKLKIASGEFRALSLLIKI